MSGNRTRRLGGNGAPTPRGLIAGIEATYDVALEESEAKRWVGRFTNWYDKELEETHIA